VYIPQARVDAAAVDLRRGVTPREPAALDLDAILARARARGLERMLLLGLGLAQRTFATRLPPPVQQRLNSDAAAAAMVECWPTAVTPGLETSPSGRSVA